MSKIKNFDALMTCGDRESRKIALHLLEHALQSLDSTNVIKDLVFLEGDVLHIGDSQWNIGKKKRIFIIGAGKAGNAMAKGIERVLGSRITTGLVIVKKMEADDALQRIELVEGGHPLPNEKGVAASLRILNLIDQAGPGDLFLCLISGGSTALLACPVPEIPLEDKISISDLLLKSGARILEMNAIRRHISLTNGGRIAQRIEARGAELINLVISDLVGDYKMVNTRRPVDLTGTPVGADLTTLAEARDILKKYDLLKRSPQSVVNYLQKDDPSRETPKAFRGLFHSFVFRGSADACIAVQQAAQTMAIPAYILTTFLEGESREAGIFLASLAKEIMMHQRPFAPPCVLVAGGETTTRMEGSYGRGGPSQELSLGFALEVAGMKGVALAALDTDGTDGPTPFAGALTDGTTVERAAGKGLSAYENLMTHNSLPVLEASGDLLVTGNTGTNLCDVNVVVIRPTNSSSKADAVTS